MFPRINLKDIKLLRTQIYQYGTGATVTVRADSPTGPVVARYADLPNMPARGGFGIPTFETFTAPITDPGGVHDLYFVIEWPEGTSPEVFVGNFEFLERVSTETTGTVGGTVPATLAVALGTPATFGAFTPGVARDYTASTTATVTSTAGDATLTVSDPELQRSRPSGQRRVRVAAAAAGPWPDQDLDRTRLQRPGSRPVQAGDRRQRRAQDGRIQQDPHVHAVDDGALARTDSQAGRRPPGRRHCRSGSVALAAVERARPEDVAATQGALARVAERALEVHRQLAAVVEVAEADAVPELVRARCPGSRTRRRSPCSTTSHPSRNGCRSRCSRHRSTRPRCRRWRTSRRVPWTGRPCRWC